MFGICFARKREKKSRRERERKRTREEHQKKKNIFFSPDHSSLYKSFSLPRHPNKTELTTPTHLNCI